MINNPCPVKNNVVQCKMEDGQPKCSSTRCLDNFKPIDNTDFLKGCIDPCSEEGVCKSVNSMATCTANADGTPNCKFQCIPGFMLPPGGNAQGGCVGNLINSFEIPNH